MEQKLEDNDNEINKLKNKIEKLTKSNIEFSEIPTLFQNIEKKDNKLKLLLQLILMKKMNT